MGIKHGMAHTRFYKIWSGIKKRCLNESEPNYINYGGRGIKLCPQWLDFKFFYKDMYEGYLKHIEKHGEKNTFIERINNNGHYEPSNCKWATRQEQNNNTRKVKLYPYKGGMLNLMDISKLEGINYRTLRARLLDYHWTLEQALEKSKNKWAKKKHKLYKHNGEMKTLTQIAKDEGINKTTLFDRVKRQKMSVNKAIKTNDKRRLQP